MPAEWKFGHAVRVLVAVSLLATLRVAFAADADEALNEWLEHQVAIESWAADVEQTRKLRALVKPLTTSGRVVFAKPQRFRWQLGDPPRTLAIGTPTGLTVAYPRLKQVERYRYSDAINPSLRQILDLLEVGFPSSTEAFYERYELVEGQLEGAAWRFVLQPRDKDARRLLERVNIQVSSDDLRLLSTEFEFPDESLMRNEFGEPVMNEPVDDVTFELEVGDDWEVVEPLAR